MYIRDYLCSQTSVEAGKGVSAKDISAFLASKGIKASFAFKIVVLRIDFYPRFPGKKSSVKKAWKI